MDSHSHTLQDGQTYYNQEKGPGYADQSQAAGYSPYPNSQYQQYPQSSAGAPSQYAPTSSGYAAIPPSAAPPSGSGGTKRGVFVALIVATVILLAMVIGLGAGLGVTQKNLHNAQADLASASAAAASAATTVYVTTTSSAGATKTSSTSTATPTPPNDGFSSCPSANNTIYNSSSSSSNGTASFNVHCGIDYGNTESANLKSKATKDFTDCMNLCASTTHCTGCGWGYIDGSGDMCYLKTNLTVSHSATSSWLFATLNTTLNATSSS
ncbi:hypothetical protein BX600DRAFT_512872 [Xylariales sp. PMI_506]|nr:hypothetical protein BX600DRAFT_512872 [Xylariales sp. PMI_506]